MITDENGWSLGRTAVTLRDHQGKVVGAFETRYDGRYEIPNVPAGTYTLRLWSELGTAEPRRVTVVESAAAEVDFQVGRAP